MCGLYIDRQNSERIIRLIKVKLNYCQNYRLLRLERKYGNRSTCDLYIMQRSFYNVGMHECAHCIQKAYVDCNGKLHARSTHMTTQYDRCPSLNLL